MKSWLVVVFTLLFANNVLAKDFHVIYLRFDNYSSFDISSLKSQLFGIRNSCSGDDFIFYYSNIETMYDRKTWSQDEIAGYINEQGNTASKGTKTEIESLNKMLDVAITSVDNSEKKVKSKYDRIIFHFFVGHGFVLQKMQNRIIAEVLLINSVQDLEYEINMYPCGDKVFPRSVMFSEKYNELKSIHIIR